MLDVAHQILIPLATASITLALFHLIAEVHIRLSESTSDEASFDDVWE